VVLMLCFKVFMPPQILYSCSVIVLFFLNTDKKNRCDSYKKRRSCVLSNISIVAISTGLPVAVNNPVPASQVGFQPVLPLCSYGKVLDFTMKNTRLHRQPTHSENAQKMLCNANHKHCASHCKPETKKTGDSSNVCVCLYRSLKRLTDDHSGFAAV